MFTESGSVGLVFYMGMWLVRNMALGKKNRLIANYGRENDVPKLCSSQIVCHILPTQIVNGGHTQTVLSYNSNCSRIVSVLFLCTP